MAGFDEADVVLAIGYDLVEHSPEHWNPRPGQEDRRASTRVPAEIDEYFVPEVELVGDLYHVLTRLSEECRHVPHRGGSERLRDVVLGRFENGQGRRRASRCSRRARSGRSARPSAGRTS